MLAICRVYTQAVFVSNLGSSMLRLYRVDEVHSGESGVYSSPIFTGDVLADVDVD